MEEIILTESQQELASIPADSSIFLEGLSGAGKTTAAIARLKLLLADFPGSQILILTPQRSLAKPYHDFLKAEKSLRGGLPELLTIGGLARRMAELFWPLIADEAAFGHPSGQMQFLTTETSQYCMERVIAPFLEKGFFRSVTIEKNRLFSQILDDLNKSAIVPFPLSELADRLKNSSMLPPELAIAYEQVQLCALEFRKYCLENNLLDYSLTMEILRNFVWPRDECREFFFRNFRVLIADNVEEDVPVAHDFIKQWLPHFQSSLLIYDQNGGYRQFLGADPVSAYSLTDFCEYRQAFDQTFISSNSLQLLRSALVEGIQHSRSNSQKLEIVTALAIRDYHFYPEMILAVCEEIKSLVQKEGVSPDGISVLSPYLSDALNFSIETTLSNMDLPFRSSRPSRKYLSDPAVQSMLIFAKLAHPQWNLSVSTLKLRAALMTVLPELDIIRADLISRTLFSINNPSEGLRSFDVLTNREMQGRITFKFGELLEGIHQWLQDYQSKSPQPLDAFLSMLYGELFSQKEYGLSGDFNAADTIARVLHSIRNFRQFAFSFLGMDEISSGKEYLQAIENGLLPSSIFSSVEEKIGAIQISPAHTFLMENRAVDFQFWLDIGSMGWWERLNQPLTNPYLLSRQMNLSTRWTEAHEHNANQAAMQRVVDGLVNRCRQKIIVCAVRTNEFGAESRGPLLQAFQGLQKRLYHASKGTDA